MQALLDEGKVPVVATVAPGIDGELYNVNADTAAAALAVAVGAEKLVVLTDVEGLYADWPASDEVISEIGADALEALLPDLSSGMVPEDGGLPAGRARRRAARPRAGRARAAQPAARAVHRRGRRDHGGAVVSATSDWQARWDAALMGNYGTPSVVLVRGEGAVVEDADGRTYVDLYAGIAVNALGHAHPAVREAVDRQLGTLGHVSNFAVSEPVVLLAERLQELTGHDRVLFTNSGAEANEAGLKIARRLRPGGGWVACDGAFHGRTLGALAITGQPAKRAPFEPLPGPVTFVPYGDAAALDARRRRRRPPPSSSSRCSARPASCCRPTGSWPPPGPPATGPARCCTSTRCRAASAAPAPGCRATCSPRASRPTSSRSPRASAAACRSARCSPAARPRPPCRRATTAPPSAATRSPAPPRSPCSGPIEAEGLLEAADDARRPAGRGHRGARVARWCPRVRGVGLWLGVVLTAPVAAAGRAAPPARRASCSTRPAADVLRLAPPLVLTEAQVDAFLEALGRPSWPAGGGRR